MKLTLFTFFFHFQGLAQQTQDTRYRKMKHLLTSGVTLSIFLPLSSTKHCIFYFGFIDTTCWCLLAVPQMTHSTS